MKLQDGMGGKGNRPEGWQRPTLPGGCPPSTIGAGGLNDRVRDGSGCTPTALATNSLACCRLFIVKMQALPKNTHFSVSRRISPRPLVPVRCAPYDASTSGLSSWSSPSGLTRFPGEEAHLEVSFPLRCFQRFSVPQVATRLCHGRDNRHTSAASTPVLSY